MCIDTCNRPAGRGTSGQCDDGLQNSITSECSAGTDCTDCGLRHLCVSCPAECAARSAERVDPLSGKILAAEFCLEDMYTSQRCHDACNNRECLHAGCSNRERVDKCIAESVGMSLASAPVGFDANTLTSSTDSGPRAKVPIDATMNVSAMSYRLNVDDNEFYMSISFAITLQWRDSRLEVSPCAYVYADIIPIDSHAPQDLISYSTQLRDAIWFPEMNILAGDGTYRGTVSVDSSTFSLNDQVDWVTGTGPAGAGTAPCQKCATYTMAGKVTLQLSPRWTFWAFPFDEQTAVFIVSVDQADLYDCSHLLQGTNRANLVPDTGDWIFLALKAARIDPSRCRAEVRMRRNGIVVTIKQLAVIVVVVLCGICVLFLHVGDHSGDRANIILVAALVCSLSFQTDQGLGSITYLMWFDWFNILQIVLLFLVLVVCFVEHQLHVSDREDQAAILNRIFRWAIPFGYYPILLVALFVWGSDRYSAAPWVILSAGWLILSCICFWLLRKIANREVRRRKNIVKLLLKTEPNKEKFIEVLSQAFEAFDTDHSGCISMNELRVLLECIYPGNTRNERAEVSLEVKRFANQNGELEEEAFIDAVLYAVEKMPPAARPGSCSEASASRIQKWVNYSGLASNEPITRGSFRLRAQSALQLISLRRRAANPRVQPGEGLARSRVQPGEESASLRVQPGVEEPAVQNAVSVPSW